MIDWFKNSFQNAPRSPTLFLKAEAKFDTGFFESGGVIFFSGMSWELE